MIVKCKCGWQGPQTSLAGEECPSCARGFTAYPRAYDICIDEVVTVSKEDEVIFEVMGATYGATILLMRSISQPRLNPSSEDRLEHLKRLRQCLKIMEGTEQ